MVYEERVEQVPYKTCRTVAEQTTIRVPRTVEKRVPVTYTYNVPRLVCYRVPLDDCGNPISESAPALSAPAPSATTNHVIPSLPEPTPARKPAAEVKPSLSPETPAVRPLEQPRSSGNKETGKDTGKESRPTLEPMSPLEPVIIPPAKKPAPQSPVYPSKTTT